jgi:hypothetical protein
MIKIGTKTRKVKATNPSGFMYKATNNSPFRIKSRDLVVPQAGQLIPYNCFEKQTP